MEIGTKVDEVLGIKDSISEVHAIEEHRGEVFRISCKNGVR